ncbi:MAG TPA: nitroreductase [Longimicrobiales bacterium]|nr:nitroreductase [Longimicrobiales bacterium]
MSDPGGVRGMSVVEAIRARRSIKDFSPRAVGQAEIEALLDAAVQAPNHRLTRPWRFYVLGPASRAAYGRALGERKARRVADADAGRIVMEKVAGEYAATPCMIAVAMTVHDNPEIREEDYAATMMAVQNILLACVAQGLGGHIRTGAVMDDPAARAAVGVVQDERIVALISVGEPAEMPPPKERPAAAGHTTWVP